MKTLLALLAVVLLLSGCTTITNVIEKSQSQGDDSQTGQVVEKSNLTSSQEAEDSILDVTNEIQGLAALLKKLDETII